MNPHSPMFTHNLLGSGHSEQSNLPSPTSSQPYSPASQTQNLAVDPQFVTKRKPVHDVDETPGKRRRDAMEADDPGDSINPQKHWSEEEKNMAVSHNDKTKI